MFHELDIMLEELGKQLLQLVLVKLFQIGLLGLEELCK